MWEAYLGAGWCAGEPIHKACVTFRINGPVRPRCQLGNRRSTARRSPPTDLVSCFLHLTPPGCWMKLPWWYRALMWQSVGLAGLSGWLSPPPLPAPWAGRRAAHAPHHAGRPGRCGVQNATLVFSPHCPLSAALAALFSFPHRILLPWFPGTMPPVSPFPARSVSRCPAQGLLPAGRCSPAFQVPFPFPKEAGATGCPRLPLPCLSGHLCASNSQFYTSYHFFFPAALL